jgi:hypothetical protein
VTHHLEAVPFDPWDDPDADPSHGGELSRPPWWRWVAIAVIVAMVVAGPLAYVLAKLLG